MFLPRLQELVAVSQAPVIKIDVRYDNRSDHLHIPKVLKNNFVEKLVVTGPAAYNILPVMGKLKEVEVVVRERILTETWSDWNIKVNNRNLIRGDICCVHVGALYGHCPKVKKFMGMEIATVTQLQPFNTWNKELMLLFHQDYTKSGGIKDIREWAKIRWFSERPVVEV